MMRWLWRILVVLVPFLLFVAIGWIAGLVALVVLSLLWLRRLGRARTALAYETTCPRGHIVRQYGVFRCGCGAVSESWVWRCPVCHQEFGHTACPTCGLSVTNPMVR